MHFMPVWATRTPTTQVPTHSPGITEIRNIPLMLLVLAGVLLVVCLAVVAVVRWKRRKEKDTDEE